jgi:hypothetical protein
MALELHPVERDAGFYWVNYGGKREVALWDADTAAWYVVGSQLGVPDDDVTVLSTRLEPPGADESARR